MERVITQFAAIGEATITTISLAIIGLIGTFATVGYKYKKDKPKPEDQTKVIFEQVNQFIKDQKEDRDNLRKELQEVREELEDVRKDNRLKDLRIDQLMRDNTELREEIEELREDARLIAEQKLRENKVK